MIKLADRVPQPLRPMDAQRITTTAATLAPLLATISVGPVKDRVKALSTAVEPAREYARLVGMNPDTVAQGFVKQQNEIVRAIERASRRAQQQKAAREHEAQAIQQQAEPTGGVPVDPYTRSEPVDADATQRRDPPQ